MSFLDSNGPLDTASAVMIVFFSTSWFLTFGLQLGFMQELMPQFLTLFGTFPADGLKFGADLAVRGGGAFALVPILITLPFFLGTESMVGGRQQRQLVALALWIGFFIVNVKNGIVDGHLGGRTSSFNLYWVVTNGFFALIHIKWVGNSMAHKLKLS